MDERELEEEAAHREVDRLHRTITGLETRLAQAMGDLAAVGAPTRTEEERRVDAFLAEVRAELIRARAKFPGDRVMTVALAEEFGELCKAVLDEPAGRVRREAVQTATMAARLVLDGDGSVNEWRKAKGLDFLVQPYDTNTGQPFPF